MHRCLAISAGVRSSWESQRSNWIKTWHRSKFVALYKSQRAKSIDYPDFTDSGSDPLCIYVICEICGPNRL